MRGHPGDYHISGTVVKNAKRKTFQQCCHEYCCCDMHMLKVHSLQCHLPSWKKPQMPTPWARSLNTYERCSLLFFPTLHIMVFAKHPKTRNDKDENGLILTTASFEVFESSQKYFELGNWNDVFVRRHVDPSNPYFVLIYWWQDYETLSAETSAGTHATRMVASKYPVEI